MSSCKSAGRTATRAGALLFICTLAITASRPLLGQSTNGGSPSGTNGGNTPPSASRAINPNAPASAAPAAQPLTVNPVTGLTSVSAANFRPLTGSERWKLYWRQNFWSVGAYFGPVVTALVLDQASNSPQEWGGGIGGFGRRLGSRIATGMVQGTFQASLAPLLHEDVRYISSAQKGFKRRALHAVVFSFMTFNNEGHTVVNIANLTSYYAATAVSTTWVPIHGSKASYVLTNGTEEIALSIPVNLVQEFWPEIRHKVLRRP